MESKDQPASKEIIQMPKRFTTEEIAGKGGKYDDDGFYILPDGGFFDPEGFLFDVEGFDEIGGKYDE